MPKKLSLTPDQEQVMIRLFRTVPEPVTGARRRPKNSIKQIITELRTHGVHMCEDTIRRKAVQLGLMEPVGAKYIPRIPTSHWSRPCMVCKTTTSRPKGQYICDGCKGRDHD